MSRIICGKCGNNDIVNFKVTIGVSNIVIEGECPKCAISLLTFQYRAIELTQEFLEKYSGKIKNNHRILFRED